VEEKLLIPQDKANHVIYGAVICLLVTLLLVHFAVANAQVFGLLASLIVGGAKEVYDYFTGGDPDVVDAICTLLGGLAIFIAGVA